MSGVCLIFEVCLKAAVSMTGISVLFYQQHIV